MVNQVNNEERLIDIQAQRNKQTDRNKKAKTKDTQRSNDKETKKQKMIKMISHSYNNLAIGINLRINRQTE